MRGALKLLLTGLWLVLMIVMTLLPYVLKWEAGRRAMVLLTFKGLNRIFALKVRLRGTLAAQRPLMLVSNHSSYMDIFVMGAHLPIAFTPKKEIARWPVIGFCCKLAGCVFVERTTRAIASTKTEIAKRMAMGRVMCVYAEGTTNDGTHLKPFKSSLFTLAEGTDVTIQPAIVRYTARNGHPLDAQGRAEIAWYDDMSLLPHLWRLLTFKSIEAELTLLPVIDAKGDRKALCAASEAVIKQALEQTL